MHADWRSGREKFPSDYSVTYLGRKTEIDMHLKGSNSRDPRYCFRVYFLVQRKQADGGGVASIAPGKPSDLIGCGHTSGCESGR